MPRDNTAEQGTRMDADAGASSVFIGVSRDLRPLMCYREPTRDAATVLIAVGRNDDRMAR
jgi:hypothetical protein